MSIAVSNHAFIGPIARVAVIRQHHGWLFYPLGARTNGGGTDDGFPARCCGLVFITTISKVSLGDSTLGGA